MKLKLKDINKKKINKKKYNFDDLLKRRRSIRRYSLKKVSFSDIVRICEAARFAPMAGNIFTIRIIIVSKEREKRKLAEASLNQGFVSEASHVLVICSDLSHLKRSYGERAEMYGRQQAGAAIENMLLKVTELGLASCWIGAFDENAIKRILKIPETIQVEALLPIGNPFGRTESKKKPDLKFIVNFEEWDKKVVKPEKKSQF